ncbi:polyprenyl synthetase family protein [Nannocystaceae bacterium ST9]
MDIQSIREGLLAMPEVRELPPMRALIGRAVRPSSIACWDYPGLACEALEGDAERTRPAAIAVFAMLCAIHLVDDMLDEDPEGLHHRLGPGIVANVASSFQAAACRAIAQAELAPTLACAIHARLATMTMATALAQHRDTQPCADEADYWRVIEGKTPPLFSCALAMGALIGGGTPEQVEGIAALGLEFGRMIQVSDDLKDALEIPLAPDWRRPTNNLALLYASRAEHPERERFVALLELLREPEPAPELLTEAQAIVWRSGAGSYCVYHLLAAHQRVEQALRALELPDPGPLERLLRSPIQPVVELLRAAGVSEPERLVEWAVPTSESTTSP